MRFSTVVTALVSLSAVGQAFATGGFTCKKVGASPVGGIVDFQVEACQGHFWQGPLCSDIFVNYTTRSSNGQIVEQSETIKKEFEVGHWADEKEFRIAATDSEYTLIKLKIVANTKRDVTSGTISFVTKEGLEVSFPTRCEFE